MHDNSGTTVTPEKRFKCSLCGVGFAERYAFVSSEVPKCPCCFTTGDAISEMCEDDNFTCTHEMTAGIAHCEKCGKPICPTCKCHDVFQVSRVTGYLQDVAGWNEGKKQELKDRHRVDV